MSTKEQLKGDSLRRQLDQSRQYATDHGLELVEDLVLEDIGLSAFTGENIEFGALRRFLEAIRDGKIASGSHLLVESLDRLSRQELTKALALFLEIINGGVTIVTLADKREFKPGQIDLPELLMSLVVLSRAHEESQTKSFRLRAAWEQKRNRADERKLTGVCPGWLELSSDRKTFQVIEDRAAVVRRIFEESAAGIGNYSIARRFNREGIPPFRSSQGWQTSYVQKIISNPAVIGHFQPCKLNEGNRVPEGPLLMNYYPQIIEESLFYRVQDARHQRRLGQGGRRGQFISNLFSGIATCAYCRSRMHFLNKGPGPKGGSYLVCDTANRDLGCQRVAWKYEHFETSFLAFVRELDLGPMTQMENEVAKRRTLDEEIAALKGKLAELELTRDRMMETLLETEFSGKFLAKQLDGCEKSIFDVTEQIRQKEEQRAATVSESSSFYESKEEIKSLIDRLKDRNSTETYRLRAQIAAKLRSLISQLIIAPAGRAPRTRKAIELLENQLRDGCSDSDGQLSRLLSEMERQTHEDPSRRRYFQAQFKDGTSRSVFPSDDNPLEHHEQIWDNDEGLIRIDKADNHTVVFHRRLSKMD
jgi:DNA invertase Pin-like site-specific DNA recombinase